MHNFDKKSDPTPTTLTAALYVGADEEFAALLAERLAGSSVRLDVAPSHDNVLNIEAQESAKALILDARDANLVPVAESDALTWRAAKGDDAPVIVIQGRSQIPDAFYDPNWIGLDIVRTKTLYADMMRRRLAALMRLQTISREGCRRAVCWGAGVAPSKPAFGTSEPLRLLAVGDPHRQFNSVLSVLDAKNAIISAAFSNGSAINCLETNAFDAIVVFASDGPAAAAKLCSTLRRNSRLFGLPIIVFTEPKDAENIDILYACGATDVIVAAHFDYEIELVLMRARRRRHAVELHGQLTHGLKSSNARLYPSEFLNTYCASLEAHARDSHSTFSICAFRVRDVAQLSIADGVDSAHAALRSAEDLLIALTRKEDLVSKATPDSFLAVFPSTTQDQAETAARRVAAIFAHTPFLPAPVQKRHQLTLAYGAAEWRADKTAEETVAQAMSVIRD